MNGYVSDAVIRRLPGYYRYLRELEAAGIHHISSQELGRRMGLTASQIRQDINCFGGFGRQGYGYEVAKLKWNIGEILGLTVQHRMVIIGAGNIGQAVASYPTFVREGFVTVGVFDAAPEKVGTKVGGITVTHSDKLAAFLDKEKIDIALIAVPTEHAQKVADCIVEHGVKGIWNFSPKDLKVPEDVELVNAHLSDSLQILSFKMLHKTKEMQSRRGDSTPR